MRRLHFGEFRATLRSSRHVRRIGRFVCFACLLWLTGCDDGVPPSAKPVIESTPVPGPPLTIRITGVEYRWEIQYAGADGTFDTDDDVRTRRHLHLPRDSPITLELRSQDYVYSVYLPHVELLELAYPDRVFTMEFDSGAPAAHELLGTQMCGFAHPDLIGELVVHSHRALAQWLDAN